MKIVKFFYDLETTGLDRRKHGIHQISGCIEVDGEIVEQFNFHVRPHPKSLYEPGALEKCRVTREEVEQYPEMVLVYRKLIKMLSKYVDPFNKKNKAFLVGFNNALFDNPFLRTWFLHNKDKKFDAYFYADCMDAMVSACVYLQHRRHEMPSFKLHRVATELGVEVDKERLHDAEYDIFLTRKVHRITTGIEEEPI